MVSESGQSTATGKIRIGREGRSVEPGFKERVGEFLTGADLNMCYQCGTCSGSCPTVSKMRYGPRKIMHMIHLGIAEPVLSSPDIWMCVSCYSCSARCPQGIPISDVMSVLRNISVERGLATDEEATFSKIFLQVLQEHGRMYEPEVLIRYYASVLDVESMAKIAPLGIGMFLKRKIGLLPERIENARELAEISAKIRGEKE
ncbi:MAG: hypothetical protein A2Y73_03395 [Chloroflexi bacterium RBG_13_56_8]|nr:MAG: hypothetical protein A2Y73_03395 [Chloroflexi bacterium RBG_13_56_8]